MLILGNTVVELTRTEVKKCEQARNKEKQWNLSPGMPEPARSACKMKSYVYLALYTLNALM